MTKWIKRAIVVVIALAVINDLGRYFTAMYVISDKSRQMVFEAGEVAGTDASNNSGWPAAKRVADESGIEVTGYTQDLRGVVLTTRMNVTGTYLIGPVYDLCTHRPLSSPIPIDNRAGSTG